MAEYVMGQAEDQGDVARSLLKLAGDDAGQVIWQPRADVPGGGVFTIPDSIADQVESARTEDLKADRDARARVADHDAEVSAETRKATEEAQRVAEELTFRAPDEASRLRAAQLAEEQARKQVGESAQAQQDEARAVDTAAETDEQKAAREAREARQARREAREARAAAQTNQGSGE